ncbi:MAG: PAS domain S-box protein [Sulfurimonas sp.]|nr:PAS domain S-box protein [Sulfurimonas sp.]
MSDSLKELTILYVEDDIMTREEIVFSLESEVKYIHVAKNGEEGLKLFGEHMIDIVLTDIKMPIMDGLKMVEQMKLVHPNIPVVVMTAFNDTDYLFKAIELGIRQYVTKPVSLKKLMSSLEEIAEQIALRKKTRRQELLLEQYKEAMDKTMMVCKSDLSGRITYANANRIEMSGYDANEFKQMLCSEVYESDRVENHFMDMIQTTQNGKLWNGIIQSKRKDGSKTFIDLSAFPIFDENNTIVEYMSIGNDVTELYQYREYLEDELANNRKNLQETLHFLEQYEDALQQATAVCHMSLEGKILGANDTFCNLLGYTKESILELSECALCKSENFYIEEILSSFKAQKVIKKEMKYKHRDGMKKTFESIFVPIYDTKGNVVEILSMHHDINELLELNQEITKTQHEVLLTLGEVAENKSEETGSHVKRVAAYSKFLAEKYGLSEEETTMLEMVAPMHDIGKIAIADAILHKPGRLTFDEMEIMKTHAYKGYKMLSHSDRPLMRYASIVALEHHEKYDGSGYPNGLEKDEIHIFGRIVAVADVFDSLLNERSYKKAWPLEDVLDYFVQQSGKHFDPKLVAILMENIEEMQEISDAHA